MDGGSHSSLHVDLSNVLPLLLQKTGKEIGSKLSVDTDFLRIHANVSDGNIEAHDLLHLELDGGLQLGHLGAKRVVVRE